MVSIEGIKNKEVINIRDGRSLGYAYDIEINLEQGVVEGIVMPAERGMFNLFGRGEQGFIIKWRHIKTIGEDVILVDLSESDSNYVL